MTMDLDVVHQPLDVMDPTEQRIELDNLAENDYRSTAPLPWTCPTKITGWYCCACKHGPWNPAHDVACADCYHRKCGSCKTRTSTTRDISDEGTRLID